MSRSANPTAERHARLRRGLSVVLVLLVLFFCADARASDYDELKVDRQEVFEFTRKPQVTRSGDRITISFGSKAYCDATVAVEGADGRIIRHLASGVLGPNAPEPFQKNSLAQTVIWDGKDDAGEYIDDKDSLTIRVSLGLKPQFEKNLLWSPHRRISNHPPIICAAPEGVYVCEGLGVDHVRLFDHDGNYVRTVYPFPADKLDKVIGLEWHDYPHDGKKWPVKHGFVQASLLSSGTSGMDSACKHHGGEPATTMSVRNGRIALAYDRLNRLATDGTSGGLPLKGPKVSFLKKLGHGDYGGDIIVGPASSAFSPDAKTLYLTGYLYKQVYPGSAGCYQGVYKLDFEKDDPPDAPPQVFAGYLEENKYGTDNAHFRVCTSVATDAKGLVYVSDFMNDRIQVFSADGSHVKSIATPKPAQVLVHQKTGEIYALSWPPMGVSHEILRNANIDIRDIKPTITRFSPLPEAKRIETYPLPIGHIDFGGMVEIGQLFSAELDSWAEQPRIWLVGRRHRVTRAEVDYWGGGSLAGEATDPWTNKGIGIFALEDGKWVPKFDFATEAKKGLVRIKPPEFSRQRLIFNPKDEKLYVAEDSGFGKSFNELIQVDPGTGKVRLLSLPFDPEDMCFDQNGLAYLRTDTVVLRYDSKTWREVPWDYGEEREHVMFSSIGGGKMAAAIAGLATPGCRPVCWHQGGMAVSSRGHLAVSCVSRSTPPERPVGIRERAGSVEPGKPYTPALYPGRARWQEIHIWDKHGKTIHEDTGPGLTLLCGVGIDRDDNIYVMADSTRAFDGKKYWNEMTGTVLKFQPGKLKVVSAGRAVVPLSPENQPKRPPDVSGGFTGTAWMNGADWLFGAAGWFGFNTARAGGGCDCWHSRFTVDYFARSFVPETERYSVAVLDPAGNVIVRVGRYGNVDDGTPLVRSASGNQQSRIDNHKSLGGDEVALFHAAYVGTHTDRRLFIHDAGNGRIVSVRLNYHATEKVELKSVPDRKQ